MHELIEELREYHREKAHHLFELEQGIGSLLDNDAPEAYVQMLQGLFEPFRTVSEAIHHHNEELILRELLTTSAPIHRRVEEISGDHKAFNRITADISSKIINQSVSCAELHSTIKSFIATYNNHANGEENIFFPVADKFIEDRHWRRIKKAWK